MSSEKKPLLHSNSTVWVRRILIMAHYNSYTTGYCNLSRKKTNNHGFFDQKFTKKIPSPCIAYLERMFLQLQLWWLLVVYKPPCLWRDPPGTKNPWKSAICKKSQKWCLDFHWNIEFAQSGVGESQAKRSSSTTGSSKKAASDGLLFSWSK